MSPTSAGKRPCVLVSLSTYLPGFRSGGPVRTIANLVDQLGEEFDFRIVAGDRDLDEATHYAGIVPDTWNPVGCAQVFYRTPGGSGWRALLRNLRFLDFDLLYLNSFFGTPSLRPLIYRRLGWLADRPVLLAPRGEFSAGALALKSFKKRLFMALAQYVGLYRDITFQASSEREAADIRRALGSVNIVVAANLGGRSRESAAERPARPARAPKDPLRAVFLSRVSRMKNLKGAIDILAGVSCPVAFDIYGVVDDAAYWTRCQDRLSELPGHVTAQYRGEVTPDQVETVLSGYDFFLLPTLGENYGHVIREALSAGLPVLISDQTPWRGLKAANAGAELPLDDHRGFVEWIESFARLTPSQHVAMRQAARRLGDDRATATRNLEANHAMLHAVINREPAGALEQDDSNV